MSDHAPAPNRWTREGCLENILGMGVDLLFYIDAGSGTHVYRLLMDEEHLETVTLRATEPTDRAILDQIKTEWEWAQHAKRTGDVLAMYSFTWRGLRLLFPVLPEDPLPRNQG